MKKRDLFPMNEMDIKFCKIVIFSNHYKILEIRKCYWMALVVTFNITVCPDTWTDSRICVESEKKCHFSSLKTILYCQAEYPRKTDISGGMFNECLSNSIARFLNFALKITK